MLWRNCYAIHEITLPNIDTLITFETCQIKNDYTTVSPTIKSIAQTLKSLLPCSVPNLQGNHFTIVNFYFLLYKICPYCCFLRQAWLLVLKTLNYARFSYSWVPNNYNFQKLFALRSWIWCCMTDRTVSSSISIRKIGTTFYMLFGYKLCPIRYFVFSFLEFIYITSPGSLTILRKLDIWNPSQSARI